MYLTQGLHRSLQRHPGKLAQLHLAVAGAAPLDRAGVVPLDMAALVQQVAQLAAALRALGVAPGDRVALLSPNNAPLLQQVLACWWLGAVACPLDPRWPLPDLHAAVADCRASLLVVDPALGRLSAQAGLAAALKAGASELDSPGLASHAAQRLPLDDSRTGGDAGAALVYTGGTAGPPKGVMLSHANLCTAALAQAAVLPAPDGVALLAVPLCQAAGLARLVEQLMAGATCLTVGPAGPAAWMAAIAEQRLLDIQLSPAMLQALLAHPDFDARRLQSLRRITLAGGGAHPPLLARARAAWPAAVFLLGYGLTETASTLCAQRLAPAADAASPGWPGAVGQAGWAAELRIVDAQGADRPAGQPGQILVRGPMVMQGYWQQPEATAAALQGAWLHTGDVGLIGEAGFLFVIDRLSDVVCSGGEDVYPVEVEAVLRRHPAVADVAVVGLPHAVWGQAVHAVVVLAPGALPQPDALRRFCRKHLAGFKCPRSLSFAGNLPVTAAGQVRKAQLRQDLTQQRAQTPA